MTARPSRARAGSVVAWAFIACLVATAPAHTQSDEAPSEEDVARRGALGDTTGTNALQDTAPDIILEAGEDGAFLTAQVGYRTYREDGNLLVSVQLKAPTEGGKEEVGFLNRDGLTGGTTGKLSLTWELAPRGQLWSGKSFEDACRQANEEAVAAQAGAREGLPATGECTEATLRSVDFWSQILDQRYAAGLFELCQEANKGLTDRLLAVEGQAVGVAASTTGYSRTCSASELATVRETSLLAAQALAGPAVIAEQCAKVNKERPQQPVFLPEGGQACTPSSLAAHLVGEEVAKKKRVALVSLCQEAHAIPVDRLLTTAECKLSTLVTHANDNHQPGYWRWRAIKAVPTTLYYITAEATQVDQTFKFLDPDSAFAQRTRSGDSRSTGFAFSAYHRGWLGVVGYAQRTEFSGAAKTQVCLPLPQHEDALSCTQAALAGPSRSEHDLFRAELRTWLLSGLGLTLRSIHDPDASAWEHHLLLHFLRDAKKGLRGGIDLQYATDVTNSGDHFTGRVFVGTKFDLPFLTP